jgi:membrane protease YdiL (CAAX protease family)
LSWLSRARDSGGSIGLPLGVAAAMTVVATAEAYLLPTSWSGTAVGATFLIATYLLVVHGDDNERIRRYGLSLGGLLELEPLAFSRLLRAAFTAIAYALGAALVIYPFFWLGFRIWWKVSEFHAAPLAALLSRAPSELLMTALPEEAFYRGYLQTELEQKLGGKVAIFGARVGFGVVATSAIFAVGHLLTEVNPARLAVFFPSLVFGFLRARTGGIGAGVVFHALCNLFSAYLLQSYLGH